ncbi:DinB family protein [uncultured Winogradskyella sp.]|uniref:DinB family protein n=1 Tax=uncultured Winogradskyella sp. TaxID=395353 RepID=UPI0035187D8A
MVTGNKIEELALLSEQIRGLTLKRLKELPDGFMNWRLNNSAMSFAHLVQHLIDVDDLFFKLSTTNAREFKWQLGSDEVPINVDASTYKTMLQTLKRYGKKRSTLISEFDDKTINDVLHDSEGNQMTYWWFIMRKVLEHETYHRGQIAAYLKVLKGEQ